jgi:hypothetical protein
VQDQPWQRPGSTVPRSRTAPNIHRAMLCVRNGCDWERRTNVHESIRRYGRTPMNETARGAPGTRLTDRSGARARARACSRVGAAGQWLRRCKQYCRVGAGRARTARHHSTGNGRSGHNATRRRSRGSPAATRPARILGVGRQARMALTLPNAVRSFASTGLFFGRPSERYKVATAAISYIRLSLLPSAG